MAQAVVSFAKAKNIPLLSSADFNSVTGKGVVGTIAGKQVALGNKKLMDEVNATVSNDIESQIIAEQKLGKTVSYIAINNQAVGYIAIADSVCIGPVGYGFLVSGMFSAAAVKISFFRMLLKIAKKTF